MHCQRALVFLTADLINRVNALLKKCFKYGYSKICDTLSQ